MGVKVYLDTVTSLNGMIARKDGREDWLPEDGWEEFLRQIDQFENFIVGRETYELVTKMYEHANFDAIQTKCKIIVTRNLSFVAPPGYVVAHSPQEAVDIVKAAGLKVAYVGGGGKLNTAFLKAGLVDTLRITVMPYIISSGRPFLVEDDFDDIQLKLVRSTKAAFGILVNEYTVMEK